METFRASFPLTPAQARAVQESYAHFHELPITHTLQLNPDVSIDFQLIPPGEFIMGLRADEFATLMSWYPDDEKWPENPLLPHLVQVDTPFYMTCTPVTQAQ